MLNFLLFKKRRIYLDYASLTPIDPRVVREIKRFSAREYANPSSWYKEGVAAKKALDSARKSAADFIHAHSDEIVFTSGGTESNNLAVIGAIESLREKGVDYKDMHIIVSAIEHSSVRECANYLNGKGVIVDVISIGKDGVISTDELKKKIRSNTVIVSIMTVNNEIGTIQPIKEIAKVIRGARKAHDPNRTPIVSDPLSNLFAFQSFNYPIFHTDASQALLYEELNVEQLGVDLLTLDGAKVYGPRGVGALYMKRNTPVSSIIHGGGQESGMRSGTENIPAIVGLVKALEIADADRYSETIRIRELRDYFYDELKKINPNIMINPLIDRDNSQGRIKIDSDNKSNNNIEVSNRVGISNIHQSPHILNVSIPKIDGEFFVMQLDAKGIACSTKSSCLRDEDESYVLKSIGANSKTSIRFSFGRWTRKEQLKKVVGIIRMFKGSP